MMKYLVSTYKTKISNIQTQSNKGTLFTETQKGENKKN